MRTESESYDGMATLIFYRMNKDRKKEPLLNRLAALATNSEFTHVEMAIGSELSNQGLMRNVVRIFNDNTGVVSVLVQKSNPCMLHATQTIPHAAQVFQIVFFDRGSGMCTGAHRAHRHQPLIFVHVDCVHKARRVGDAGIFATADRQAF